MLVELDEQIPLGSELNVRIKSGKNPFSAVAEVARAVEFGYEGEVPGVTAEQGPDTRFEAGISVDYVFEDLVANRALKNVFIEAADTHLDMHRNHREVCRRFEETQSLLTEMYQN